MCAYGASWGSPRHPSGMSAWVWSGCIHLGTGEIFFFALFVFEWIFVCFVFNNIYGCWLAKCCALVWALIICWRRCCCCMLAVNGLYGAYDVSLCRILEKRYKTCLEKEISEIRSVGSLLWILKSKNQFFGV